MRLQALWRATALGLAIALMGGCASVRTSYHDPSYDVLGAGSIKRIAVGAWAPVAHPGLGPLLVQVGTDLVKLRKNYLVVAQPGDDVPAACRAEPRLHGVLQLRALQVTQTAEAVDLQLETALWRCLDGALVHRADARKKVDPDDDSLTSLVRTYGARTCEADAAHYAAAAFVVLQPLVEALPNPNLTDDEVAEKIELD